MLASCRRGRQPPWRAGLSQTGDTRHMANTLKANSLGITESVIMGIAGTAPAYSIEITTSTIIATAGALSPAAILVCGLIMFGIAFAFINLNRELASVGTRYSCVTMVL